MNKYHNYSKYKNGIAIPSLIGTVLFFILYSYSRLTSPGVEVFLSDSLYSLAVTVLIAYLACLFLLYLSIHRYYFSKLKIENNPQNLLYHLQSPFKSTKYKLIFLISSLIYFVFFGFLSNIFIYFMDENTVFSIYPFPPSDHLLHEANVTHTTNHHQDASEIESLNTDLVSSIDYPTYKLIICCNYIGYLPMLILQLSESLSILIIPLNLIIGIALSVLVGLNVTLNIFILSKNRTVEMSKRNLFGAVGISMGLFVGCPTCTGSLFYSLVGFSSLVFLSSLNIYQILFVIISIPMLFGSLIFMMNILRKTYLKSCQIKD
ncbi:MAG: hypothetical protein ACHQ1D_07775 [Nitrososphaerales archaeon]